MTIVNPLSTPNMVAQPTTVPVETQEQRQVDLRPEQMVRATVVEGGVEKALLEMNHRHFRAQSDIELQAGQKLTLQVLQTQPTLELRIVNDPLGGRLAQLLPLLSQPYDWLQLLDSLTQRPLLQNLPQSTAQVYQQLQQLLQPDGQIPAELKNELQQLPAQLQQLSLAVASGRVGGEVAVRVNPSGPVLNFSPVSADKMPLVDLPQLLRGMQGQLNQLQAAEGRPVAQNWITETRSMLAPLQQTSLLEAIPLPQMKELLGLVTQIRQQPSFPPQLNGELERMILQLKVQSVPEPVAQGRKPAQQSAAPPTPSAAVITAAPANAASQPGPAGQTQQVSAQQLAETIMRTGVYKAPLAGCAPVQPAQMAPVMPAEISAGLGDLLTQVQAAQSGSGKISPELLGRLEGLLDKLQQLPQATQPVLPGLEAISSQLTQLVQQGPQLPEGGQLGLLSQLFGFHLEAELLKGQKKEALASLKLSLLAMQKELGEEVREPLRRLELFQLCKARLSDDQIQFLPLPFNELEEGYLLMEKASQEDEGAESEPPLQMTLSLRVSALGNMRVDILYDKQGLHLRMACEDKEKMEYVQEHAAELEEAIASVPLQSLNFSADAEVPTRQLMEKLLPEALSVLDARI